MFWFILMFTVGGVLALCGVVVARIEGWLTTRRSLKVALFIVLFCAINAPLTHHFSLQTVAFSEQSGDYEYSPRWGYQLRYDSSQNETELSLWEGRRDSLLPRDRMHLSYKYPTYFDAPVIKEERWLADGKAIYLKFEMRFDNSYPVPATVRFIHDFQRGQSFATRHTSRWLIDKSPPKPEEPSLVIPMALTEEAFDEVLWELEKRKE